MDKKTNELDNQKDIIRSDEYDFLKKNLTSKQPQRDLIYNRRTKRVVFLKS